MIHSTEYEPKIANRVSIGSQDLPLLDCRPSLSDQWMPASRLTVILSIQMHMIRHAMSDRPITEGMNLLLENTEMFRLAQNILQQGHIQKVGIGTFGNAASQATTLDWNVARRTIIHLLES